MAPLISKITVMDAKVHVMPVPKASHTYLVSASPIPEVPFLAATEDPEDPQPFTV